MGVTLERVQFRFASIIGELCSEPDILSQFAVWVDLRLAEYKFKGCITLECDGDTPDPVWLKGILSALLKRKCQAKEALKPCSCAHQCKTYPREPAQAAESQRHHCVHECPCTHHEKCAQTQQENSTFNNKCKSVHQTSVRSTENKQVCKRDIQREASKDDFNASVPIKVEDDDYVIVVPQENGVSFSGSAVRSEPLAWTTPCESTQETSGEKSEAGVTRNFEAADTPDNQSLMSIIGNTLPETDFPSGGVATNNTPSPAATNIASTAATFNITRKKEASMQKSTKTVHLGQTPSSTFPVLSTPVVFQAVSMVNNPSNFVNSLNTGSAGVNMNPISLHSARPPQMSVPAITSLHLSPHVSRQVCNTAFPHTNANKTAHTVTQKLKSQILEKSKLETAGNKRKNNKPVPVSSTSSTSTNSALVDAGPMQKKIKVSSETPKLSTGNSCVSIKPASGQSLANPPPGVSVWPGLQSIIPNLSANQVPAVNEATVSCITEISPKEGKKVCLKYPMTQKKRSLITKYRPILPADSGAHMPASHLAISNSSPKK